MNEETLFHLALAKLPHERAAFLDEACGGDSALRERLGVLLAAHEQPGSFMQSPALGNGNGESDSGAQDHIAARSRGRTPRPRHWTVQAPAKNRRRRDGHRVHGRAGHPIRRTVALKIIKPGMDSRQVIARFEAERQALAVMDHPNIAKVLDAGTTESGRPYFVMELVKGVPITQYADEHRLTPRQRLELFIPVCQAVQHAHQKGIIHRDLKPTNVIVRRLRRSPGPQSHRLRRSQGYRPAAHREDHVHAAWPVVGTIEYM